MTTALSSEARTQLDALLAELAADPTERALQAQRHLFARIRPADGLEVGESYDVDLAKPAFVHTLNGKPITWARAQLVGTHSGGTFLWGWQNPSIAPAGSQALHGALASLPGLDALLAHGEFELSAEDAGKLAQALALKAGFFAVYPAPVGGALAFLALKVRLAADAPEGDEKTMWCSGCGLGRTQVKALIAGAAGCICENCTRQLLDLRAVSDSLPDDLEAEPVDAFMAPCILTGRRTPRVYLPFVAVSWSAVELLERVMRENGHL